MGSDARRAVSATIGIVSLWLLISAPVLVAQAGTTNPSNAAPTITTGQQPGGTATPQTLPQGTLTDPKVVDAYREGREFLSEGKGREWCSKNPADEGCKERRTARLNEIIYVKVAHLQRLLDDSKCLEPSKEDPSKKARRANCLDQSILLFLNGRPIKGLFPESGAPEIQGGEGTLRFHLRRYVGDSETDAEESDEHWADLLGLDPASGEWHLTRDGVRVSVGLDNHYPVATEVTDFRLRRMRHFFLLAFMVLAVVILWALGRLARESDLLRDRKPVLWGQRKPYSLSATQAAWWFVLTIMSFVFIWLVTGDYDLSTSVLVLLGIGFGTALGSTVIDQSKGGTVANGESAPDGELQTLLMEKENLEASMDELRRQEVTAKDKSAIKSQFESVKTTYQSTVRGIRQKYPHAIGPAHTSFYLDLLSDESGVNFHRFQMAVWTVVLGFIFVYSVLSRLAMPVFSETLLGLMGLSAGTYLGFKIPENNSAPPTPPAAGGATPTPPGQ